MGATSFDAKGNWNAATAPAAGNNYFTATYGLRTPPTTANYVFAGDSLTFQPPTTSGYSVLVKSLVAAGATWSMTINNLTNAGGLLRSGGNTGSTTILTGNVFAVTANSTLLADQCSWVINSPLAGSGILTNNYLNSQLITYGANNSAFTGSLWFGTGAGVIFAHPLSAPGNPVTPTPGQITTTAAMTIQDTAGITLTNANGGITLGGNLTLATVNAGSNTTIGVSISDNSSGFSVTKNGAGTLTFSGSNYFSGGLTLGGFYAGSTFRIGNSNAVGTGPITITGGNNLLLDNVSSSAMTLPNNNAQTWNSSFGFIGTRSLDMGNGSVSLGSSVTVTVSNNTLTVGSVYKNVYGYGLTKAGAGTLTLNGGGYYNGTTAISNGVLALASSGAPLYSTNIFIASNATLNVTAAGGLTLLANQMLSGSGTVLGALTDNSSAILAPGGSSFGTLTITGGLTLNGAGTLNFDLSSSLTPGAERMI
ncbi:MAG: autotransporter-associated beta strand repeat-containing protein [Verrucomicrobiota bacterium]